MTVAKNVTKLSHQLANEKGVSLIRLIYLRLLSMNTTEASKRFFKKSLSVVVQNFVRMLMFIDKAQLCLV